MKTSEYTYDYFIDSFTTAKEIATDLSHNTDTDVFFAKPSPGKWSMAEILSHLNQAGNQYFDQIENRLSDKEKSFPSGKEPFTPNAFIRYFIKMVSPENQKPLPTVPSFKPKISQEEQSQKILDDFLTLQDSILGTLNRCKEEKLDLDKIMTWNPIIKIIPMSLTACYGVTEAHQRRHFGQMKSLQKDLGRI